jgi:hypothetical protein
MLPPKKEEGEKGTYEEFKKGKFTWVRLDRG